MPVPHHPVPGPKRSIDGLSILPGRSLIPVINWEALKREFLLDPDYTRAQTWLHQVKMWPVKKIRNGNTWKKINGWSADKAALERQKTEQQIQTMLDEQRRRTPELMKAKLNLVVKIIADVGKWDRLLPVEKKLCFEILKTELGEPTSIKTVGVVSAKDPVEALLEEYGLMKQGRIIIDDQQTEGESSSPAIAAVSGGSPVQVPSS